MPKTTAALPRVEPIVPTLRPAAFNNPAWLFEPKYDGYRGVFYLTRQGCAMYSKRGNRFSRFPELCEGIRAELGRREVILDGEVIALDSEGRMDFWSLMRGHGRLAYAAFDLLSLNGRDLRQLPLTERQRRLKRLVSKTAGTLLRIPRPLGVICTRSLSIVINR
jgi:bifunctional non-homologous end joining protein LigD